MHVQMLWHFSYWCFLCSRHRCRFWNGCRCACIQYWSASQSYWAEYSLNFVQVIACVFVFVPATAIPELLQELHYLLISVSVSITFDSLSKILKKCSVQVNESVDWSGVEVLSFGWSLASAYKRKQYYKKHFNMVKSVEYNLDPKTNATFQYIPMLPSLQHLLSNRNILESVIHRHETQELTLDVVQCF